MPRRSPHEAGLQLAGDPPSFDAKKAETDWHLEQDAWLAHFSEGKRTLPPPGQAGSAESKARSKAWRAELKAHAKAKRMSLAMACDADANASLDLEASRALHAVQSKKRAASEDGLPFHSRPPGPAPAGYEWDTVRGKWFDKG